MKYLIILMLLVGCGKETSSTSTSNTGTTSTTTEKKICSIVCKEREPTRGYCLEEVFECEDI